jgi:hypothetical protein
MPIEVLTLHRSLPAETLRNPGDPAAQGAAARRSPTGAGV